MIKKRIQSIEYIRGIAMLGVIGIHTGAYSLTNPHANVHLFALLEIVTRFSVPIFFFISAFGLFFSQNLQEKLNYPSFMVKRARTVLVPYIAWSLLYMFHYTAVSGDTLIWTRPLIYKYFLFGLASYQLYFLVILLWFYTLMPLWRSMTRYIIKKPFMCLGILLVLQIAFNYYSSYILAPKFSNHYINVLVEHRLDYWVVHYLFIFLLGAVCATKFAQVKSLVERYYHFFLSFFLITLGGMLFYYYRLLYCSHYTPESAVNTVHQLSPIGVLYTFAASMFLMAFLNRKLPSLINLLLGKFSEHSYVIYLVHPFIMFYLSGFLIVHNRLMTGINTILFYTGTVVLSLLSAMLIHNLAKRAPLIGVLLAGKAPKIKNK